MTEIAGRLRFGVLGPLEARRDGVLVRLGGERQRALLAVLLARANELVMVEVLVEALFGDQRSESAVNAVRVGVSRLRRVLESADGDLVVETHPGGYALAVESGQLDVEVFEQLLAEGRGLLAAGNAVSAAARLREALCLWRGVAYADVAGLDYVQGEIRRLEELRLVAVMDRVDADLALGDTDELVVELEQLVALNPLQERLRGQLMLALYRAGRQSDALAVYREISGLSRELGLEPGRALKELERSILRQDTALDVVAIESAIPSGLNLPVAATPFVGRVRELADVIALLARSDARLLTLTGAGGTGKTRLALRAAQALVPDSRDGMWFVALADITDSALIAPKICQALELVERPDIPPVRRIVEWLATRKVLLVLDNLEQLAPETGVFSTLLAAAPGLRLLATSREPLHLAGEQQYEVPVLEPEDAVELFSARAHQVAPRMTVDPDLSRQICERLDRLPLAIELAAARVKTLPPGEILSRLEQGLPVLATGPRDAARRQQTLTATIDWSYDLLAVDEQRLFAWLSVFAGGFTFAAAEAICDADLDALQALRDRSLLMAENGRYAMLQTLREYALDRLERSAKGDELRRRHAYWYAGLLGGITDWDGSQSPILRSRHLELENLLAALQWAAARGEIETVAQLTVLSCQWAWSRLGRLDEAERWLTIACEHQHDLPLSLRAALMSEQIELLHKRGEHAAGAAFCEQALVMYRELEDDDGIMWSLSSRSTFASERGDFAGARSALEEQIVHARAYHRPGWVPGVLCNLADVAILEGNLDEAQAFCEEGLALVESLGKTRVEPYLLVNLAGVANRQGRHSNAAECGHKALAANIDHQDLFIAAAAILQIGWSLAVEGEPEQAARFLGSSLGFNEDAGATLQQTDRFCQQRAYEILTAQFDEATLRTLLDEGRRTPMLEAIANALNESFDRPDVTHNTSPELP